MKVVLVFVALFVVSLFVAAHVDKDDMAAAPRLKCESAGSAWVCSLRPFIGSDGENRKAESCACVSIAAVKP